VRHGNMIPESSSKTPSRRLLLVEVIWRSRICSLQMPGTGNLQSNTCDHDAGNQSLAHSDCFRGYIDAIFSDRPDRMTNGQNHAASLTQAECFLGCNRVCFYLNQCFGIN
jgi:hypothetical protein